MNTINGNFLERTIPSLKGALVTLNMGNSTSEMNLEDLATNLGAGVTSIIAGSGISVDQSTGNVTVTATGGGGGTNPTSTYVPYNNEGTFADSYIINDTANSVLKTGFEAQTGLKLDYSNRNYILGDYDNNVSGTSLIVNDEFKYIQTLGSYQYRGLNLDFNTEIYTLGDYNGLTTNTRFVVDVNNQVIKTTDGGTNKGVFLDFANNEYTLGDVSNTNSLEIINNQLALTSQSNSIKIDGDNNEILTKYSGSEKGLKLNFSSSLYSFGDFGGTNNSTKLEIDDANQKLILSANLETTNAGSGAAGKRLKITIGGSDYLIDLITP